KSTVHDWFQRRCAGGVMERIWAALVAGGAELGGAGWQWQRGGAGLGKDRVWGGKGGPELHGSREEWHQEEDAGRWRRGPGGGGRMGATIAGAHVLEGKLLGGAIEAIVVERPEPTAAAPQHLSLDGGYDNAAGRAADVEAKYIPHIHTGGEVVKPTDRKPGYKPRRWVV